MLRKKIMARDGHICQACSEPIIPNTPFLRPIVDHRIPHDGDLTLFWDESNLQTLHHQCHNAKTGNDKAPRLTFGVDGWPIEEAR